MLQSHIWNTTSGWCKAFQHSPGPNVAIHHNKFIHIFACLYSVFCVTHISTQLAYCANLMVMLSCIAIMKLLHQTNAVLRTPCPKQLHHRMQ